MTPPPFPDLRSLTKAELKAWADAQPAPELPEEPERYFHLDRPGVRLVPLSDLASKRDPEDDAAAVHRAMVLAAAAREGRFDRREPVTVSAEPDGTLRVIDGTSTYGAAKRLGWQRIPVIVQNPPSPQETKAPTLPPLARPPAAKPPLSATDLAVKSILDDLLARKSAMPTRTVRFLRHAESEAEAGIATMCPASNGLTEAGRRAAEWAAICEVDPPPDLIVVSPFRSAEETAQPFRDHFRDVPVETWPVEAFAYLSPAQFANSTPEQRRPAAKRFWKYSSPRRKADDTETFLEFLERVRGAVTLMDGRDLASVLVITHESFIQAVRWLVDQAPKLDRAKLVREFREYRAAHPVPPLGEWVLDLGDPRVAEAMRTRPGQPRRRPRLAKPSADGTDQEASRRGLEQLIRDSYSYRSGDSIRDLFGFLGQITNYSPYNAMLLHVQRPNARLVLSASEWKKLGRTPRPDAHPLVILAPMGPVAFVFEESDTEGKPLTKVPLLGNLFQDAFAATGTFTAKSWERLVKTCQKAGIDLVEEPGRLWAAGRIRRRGDRFSIQLNRSHPPAVRLVALCHELAHLFCGHLGEVLGLCKNRSRLSRATQEIEAEATAYLVAQRMGINSHSHRYLRAYLDWGEKPAFNLDAILVAAGKIEGLWNGSFRVNKA